MSNACLNGRYQVLDLLGSGGEARVYRARDETTGELVAVRLAREHEMTQQIPDPLPPFHPGWVRFRDAGVAEPHGFYQVYELLEGETLEAQVERGPLAAADFLELIGQSLDAVEALHAGGWVHGDLNADNFILTAEGRRWKLLELPFLRFIPAKPHSPLFGNMWTLAPEQIDGGAATVRADLYALGCLFYAAASGKFPHAGDGPHIAVERLLYPARPVAELAPGLDPNRARGIMQLLKRKPEDRPESVAAARTLL